MRKISMENIVTLIVVIVIALLIVVLLILNGVIKYQASSAKAYDIRRRADAVYTEALMRGRHAETTKYGTVIIYGPNDRDWEFEPKDGSEPITPEVVEMKAAHQWAVEIVGESIRKLGADSNKILPGNKWSSADQWQEAVNYLKGRGLVIATNGGTLIKSGTVQTLMQELAVASLPRRNTSG